MKTDRPIDLKNPVLVISDDVDLFHSAQDAERYLEAPEIRAGVKVYNVAGQPLRAVVVRRFLLEAVKLEEDPDATPDIPALRARLIRLIVGREQISETSLADLSLEELIARARRHITG